MGTSSRPFVLNAVKAPEGPPARHESTAAWMRVRHAGLAGPSARGRLDPAIRTRLIELHRRGEIRLEPIGDRGRLPAQDSRSARAAGRAAAGHRAGHDRCDGLRPLSGRGRTVAGTRRARLLSPGHLLEIINNPDTWAFEHASP